MRGISRSEKMEFAEYRLEEEYERCIDKFPEERDSLNGCLISIDEVLYAYFSLIAYCLESGEDERDLAPIGLERQNRQRRAAHSWSWFSGAVRDMHGAKQLPYANSQLGVFAPQRTGGLPLPLRCSCAIDRIRLFIIFNIARYYDLDSTVILWT